MERFWFHTIVNITKSFSFAQVLRSMNSARKTGFAFCISSRRYFQTLGTSCILSLLLVLDFARLVRSMKRGLNDGKILVLHDC